MESEIKIGMKVLIVTIQKREVTGIVEDVGVKRDAQDGVMVRLKSGEVGRVKKIILSEKSQIEIKIESVKKLLEKGEDFHSEFKTSAFWSITYNPIQIKESKSNEVREFGQSASKVIIAKSLAAFLNSEGGNLLIGINESKNDEKLNIIGIEEDLKRINQNNLDSFKRVLIDEIIRKYFPSKIFNHLDSYLSFEFIKMDNKTICDIKVKKSDSRVFLNINNKELFMIRVNSENRTLQGEKLVDYCIKKWGPN